MKNTRIKRLKQSKRIRKITKVLMVGMLVCPLSIGAIKALADETETETTVTTEETSSVEQTSTDEPATISSQKAVTSTSEDTLEQSEQTQETKEVETVQSIDNSQTDVTQEIIHQKNLINSWYSIEGTDIIESGDTASYRFFFNAVYDDNTSTEEELTLEEIGTQLTSSDPSDVISGNTVTFGNAGTRFISASSGTLMVEVTDENHTLYRVHYVYEDGSPLLGGSPTSDRRYAPTGKEITEVAQDIGGHTLIGESTQTKIIASDGSTVFTFVYVNNADKTKLKQAIEKAEAKLAEGGWKDTTELETVLANAKLVLDSNFLPQESIDEALTSLNTALSALVKVESETPNITELENSIKEAESKLTAHGYTAESTKALRQALQNAKVVLTSPNSTQAEIDEALTSLNSAISALKKIDGSNGGDSSNENNDTSNSGGTSNTSSSKEESSNSNKQNNNSKQINLANLDNSDPATGKFPQTGEKSNSNILLAGLAILGISMLAWFKRKKKA